MSEMVNLTWSYGRGVNLFERFKLKKLLLAVSFVALLIFTGIVAFKYGASTESARVAGQLAATQAMLSFNHFLRYRELEDDLSNGCHSESLEKIKISKDQELKLLSSFFNEHGDTWVNKYVSDRDPNLINQLKVFKSVYGNTWIEPKCAEP